MPSVVTSLNAEWRRLASSSRARKAAARWAAEFPVLKGISNLDDILRRREERRDAAPDILRALAELAVADELAARTLLQALLPGILSFARRNGADGVVERVDEMVSLAWERIRTYPLHRQGSVAANVLWDTRSRYWRESHDPRCSPGLPHSAHVGLSQRSAEEEALNLFTLADLADACRRGSISRPTYELIIRTRFTGTPLTVIARDQQPSYRALAARRRRAEQRLRQQLPRAS